MSESCILFFAGLFGASGVLLGAYSYHGLRVKLAAPEAYSFATGVRYQLVHALLLLFLSGHTPLLAPALKTWIAALTILGVFFFSGLVYCRHLAPAYAKRAKALGPLTPLGGLMLAAAWLLLALASFFH